MSKRFEFLEDGAELLVGDELEEEFGEFTNRQDVALVMGNPWGTAAVLVGTRESISATLRGYLDVVNRQPPVVVEAGQWPAP